jgi:Fur family ferric uptake transcriptional regulator
MSCVATLKAKGLKLTPQRILIADIIHGAKGHLTAEDIIERARAKMPGVNKSTVYRTLELLAETGCVFKSELGDQIIYHHADEGHHHHLVCRECGKTVECDEDLLAPMAKSLKNKYSFNIDFNHLIMSGVCKDCQKNKN